ncbi:hypothetical protein Tco_1075395, partial [Tanacetum coccineum]
CKARVVFNLVPGSIKFMLNVFDTIHNHELEHKEFKHLSKRERQLTYAEQVFIVKAASVNIGDCDAQMVISKMENKKKYVSDFSFDYLVENAELSIQDGVCSFYSDRQSKEVHYGCYTKSVVKGSEVSIIKENPFVHEMPNKKKKSQSMDKGKDKDKEDDTVNLFFKKDGLYKVLRDNANVEMIPQQYILRRWTKNLIPATLRNKINRYGEKNVIVENFANEATLIFDRCVHLLSKDDPRLDAFVEKLKLLKKDVEVDCPSPTTKNKIDNLEQLVRVPKPLIFDVNNPSVGTTKGR